MTAIKIVNCHIHTFTLAHVPRDFPYRWTAPLRNRPGLVALLARIAGSLPGVSDDQAETLARKARFQAEGNLPSQAAVLENVMRHYPGDTRFVVLPMDMELSGYGAAEKGIEDQHRELFDLTRTERYGRRIIPFASVHPDRPGALDVIRRAVEDYGFRGLKIYPPLGHAPDHRVLMDEIYPYIIDRDLPVMTHCSRGGIRMKGWSAAEAHRVTRPMAYDRILREQFPEMRLCLAHFGGQDDWRAYNEEGYDPEDPDIADKNWQVGIRRMIESGVYPNLYTDISYTLFHFAENIPFLELFLAETAEPNPLRGKVLFGSDFYMTRQEELSERAVCFRLRNALGEATFRLCAETNVARWLGEG